MKSNNIREKVKRKPAFSVPRQRRLLELFDRIEARDITFGVFLDQLKQILKIDGDSGYTIHWRMRKWD